MAMGIDGLVSGLSTTSLIDSLMQAEAVPQTLLKNKVTGAQSVVTALQGLNSKVADLATLAGKTAPAGALDVYRAASNSSTASATVAAGASAGQVEMVVARLAQTQSVVSGALTEWTATGLTITGADGPVSITPASTSLDDVVKAVNASSTGVRAVKVAAGVGQYRVQFTSTAAGEAGGFTISDSGTTFTQVRAAQDAQAIIWKGTDAETVVASSTNTFSDLLPGVAVTVSAVSSDPVIVMVTRDDAKISSIAKGLVDAVNGVLAYISTQTAVTNSTDASGNPKVAGGIFTSNSTVRDVQDRILSAASSPVNGKSPSEFGISITRYGTMEFDADKFASALAADPAGTQAVVQEISSRVQGVAAAASDKYDGQLTTAITGQQFEITDMNRSIADWGDRLVARRASLQRTYSALEVQLGAMKSQSTWLSGQLAGLSSNGA